MYEVKIDIDKIIDNYRFDEEKIEKEYGNDYKKIALELAKENQRLGIKNISLKNKTKRLETIIKKVKELIENDYFEDGSFYNYDKVLTLLDMGVDKE